MVKSNEIILESMECKQLRDLPSEEENLSVQIEIKSSININKKDKREANVCLEVVVKGRDDYVFETKLRFRLDYFYDKEVNEEDVERSLEESMNVVGSKISYLNSLLTNEVLGVPLIVPPRTKYEKDE